MAGCRRLVALGGWILTSLDTHLLVTERNISHGVLSSQKTLNLNILQLANFVSSFYTPCSMVSHKHVLKQFTVQARTVRIGGSGVHE